VFYVLTLSVSPTSGVIGDIFTFRGSLTVEEYGEVSPVPGERVELILEETGEVVGSDVTDIGGSYEIRWTADRGGVLHFHTEALG